VVRRRTGLFLVVVVVVVTVLTTAPASATSAAALPFHFLRRLDGVRQLLEGEADAPLVRVHPDHQERQLIADADELVGPPDRTIRHLRDVQQPVHPGLQLDERTEVGEADDLARHPRAHRIALLDRGPRVGLDLLEPEGDPLVLAIEIQDLRLDLLALLEDLRRVTHVAGPGHIRDVQQAVDPRLELDEGAEIGEVPHPAEHPRAGLVPLLDRRPRIGLYLLHAERDALGGTIDVEHDHVDLVAHVDQLRRVPHATGPRHLRDVDEPFHTGLELDEGPVVGEAHDLALGLGAGGIGLLDALPRIRRLLLVAQRHPAGLAIEVEHHDLDLIADLEDLRGMAHPPPAHVGHMEKTINATEVDEGTVVGDVLDGAREHHAFVKDLQCMLLLLLALLLEDRPAREHDVAAAPVELDHLGADRLADHRGQVLHRPEIHLGARQERFDPDVDGEPALDDLDHAALDRCALLVCLGDRVPDLDLIGLVLRKDDEAFGVFLRLEVDLDLLAHLRQAAVAMELLDRDRPFALVADVDEHLARADVDHAAADHLAFLKLGHAGLIPVLHTFLGCVTALPTRPAEVLPWFVLLHTARSSSHFICPNRLRLEPTPAGPGRCRQSYRPGAAKWRPSSDGLQPRTGPSVPRPGRPRTGVVSRRSPSLLPGEASGAPWATPDQNHARRPAPPRRRSPPRAGPHPAWRAG